MNKIMINFKGKACVVLIGGGIVKNTGSYVLNFINKPKNAVIVTDKIIANLHLKKLVNPIKNAGINVSAISIPPGESQKNIYNLRKLYEFFLSVDLERWSPVFALGGGVVGDLAGFAAASYKRGVPFFQIPTTLLAQVDASIGGKTAINLPQGKNLVGAFYQPLAIFTDPTFLKTLSDRDIRSGLGEIVKFGMIKDKTLLDFVRKNAAKILSKEPTTLEKVVHKTASIKASIVERDEKELGSRVILNYGHTIGHAIESLSSYGRFRHGEAVAIGMECEALMAIEMGIADRGLFEMQHELLNLCGLPTKVVGLKPAQVIDFLGSDKKTKGGKLRFVLPKSIGKVIFPVTPPKNIIYKAVKYICER